MEYVHDVSGRAGEAGVRGSPGAQGATGPVREGLTVRKFVVIFRHTRNPSSPVSLLLCGPP